jgi:hypothetical protein
MSEVYIKFSPCLAKKDTIIKKLSDTIISIDGEEIGPFDLDGVSWPDVFKETSRAVLEAHRTNGDLYLTVIRYYSGSCSEWDDGKYHKMEVEV